MSGNHWIFLTPSYIFVFGTHARSEITVTDRTSISCIYLEIQIEFTDKLYIVRVFGSDITHTYMYYL